VTVTYQDLVDETVRRLMPAQMDLTCVLNANLSDSATSFRLTGPMVNGISYGQRLAIDAEVMYVRNWTLTATHPTHGTATVYRGFDGSTAAAHTTSALVYIEPKYTTFDIMGAINEELDGLSGPTVLYQVKGLTITYNPVFTGYDFPATDSIYDVLGIRYMIAPPTHNYPPIKGWWWTDHMSNPIYPSNRILKIDSPGWPGLPMRVWYSCAFTHLTALTQTVQTQTGFPVTANDILPMGAAIRLTLGREIKRNFIESQPDPRKPPEVPPGAIVNSVKGLQWLYQRRITQERAKLRMRYAKLRVRP
jgi:hypothetical protein